VAVSFTCSGVAGGGLSSASTALSSQDDEAEVTAVDVEKPHEEASRATDIAD
jgi:hypothetical protein